ncbi:MAG: membrane protein insertion efficiency factor YidD [Planctomycetota bacterium]|nr:membrane protein insertion efficiency factor YidD [Planctomycetota bacterium]
MIQLLRRFVTLPVRFYRRWLTRFTPPMCRFHPTCSSYCVEAIESRGIFKGALLTLWRLMRCHPFAQGGYDPVPQGRDSDEPAPLSSPSSRK